MRAKTTMPPRLAVIGIGFALLAFATSAQTTWDLVTADEEARDRAAPHVSGPADLPAPPVIELLRPDISRPVSNPTTIEVRFSAGSGAPVDMRTFKATYGWLGINITSKLLAHAKKTSDTLLAEAVDLPSGNHKVTLSIANSTGKTASRTFHFSIVQ
jgi:hypothetical protein